VADGRPLESVDGLSYRRRDGQVTHDKDRAILADMDQLPFVTPVYKRHLRAEDYYIGYLLAPVSVAVHRAGVPVAVHVLPVAADRGRAPVPHPQRVAEAALVRELFPQVKEQAARGAGGGATRAQPSRRPARSRRRRGHQRTGRVARDRARHSIRRFSLTAVSGPRLRRSPARVEAVGGRVVLDSPRAAGTTLRAEIPLATVDRDTPAVGAL
jgi:hypothetical protein